MVKLLAAKGADLEKVDKHGRSALMIAVEKGDSALALALLSLGADIGIVDIWGQDLFQKAVAHVDVTILRALLERCREASEKSPDQCILKHCVNKRDNKGRTLIHRAALQGNLEVVELLLEYGADVNASSR
jgi:ankyrin repeat protein